MLCGGLNGKEIQTETIYAYAELIHVAVEWKLI